MRAKDNAFQENERHVAMAKEEEKDRQKTS